MAVKITQSDTYMIENEENHCCASVTLQPHMVAADINGSPPCPKAQSQENRDFAQ